jgi:hypothetical protein
MVCTELSQALYEKVHKIALAQEIIANEFEPSYITAQSKIPHLVEYCGELLNVTLSRRAIFALPINLHDKDVQHIAELTITELSDSVACDMISCTISFYNVETTTSSQTTTSTEKKQLRWLADRLPELKDAIAETLLLADKIVGAVNPDVIEGRVMDADEHWALMYPYLQRSVAEISASFYSHAFIAETSGQSLLQYRFLNEYEDDYVYTEMEETLHRDADGIEKPEHQCQYQALLAEVSKLTAITAKRVGTIKGLCFPHRIQLFREHENAMLFRLDPERGVEL